MAFLFFFSTHLACIKVISLMQRLKLRSPILDSFNFRLSNVVVESPKKSLEINLTLVIQIKNFEQGTYLLLDETLLIKTLEKLFHLYLGFVPR